MRGQCPEGSGVILHSTESITRLPGTSPQDSPWQPVPPARGVIGASGSLATLAQMNHDDEAEMAQYIADYTADWNRLWDATARAEDVYAAERLVREFAAAHGRGVSEVDVVLMARVMSDPNWARRHPASALVLAWKHRHARPMGRSLLWLWRPRFTG
jgi:hypothetical protein